MGSSFMRAGKTLVREGFEQISKQLTKEQPNVAGKILGGLDNTTKNLLSKEIADYPPSAKTLKDIMRNHPEDFPVYIRQLKGEKVTKQTTDNLKNILDQNKPKPEVKFPSKYDVQGKEGKAYAESRLGDWYKEQLKRPEIGNDPSKINRQEFAGEGVFVDGQKQGIKGFSKGNPQLYSLGPMEERAFQLNPENHPAVTNFFEQGKEKGVIPPEVTFEGFKKEATYTANLADRLTARLTKMWGLDSPTKGVLGSFPEGMKIDGKKPYVAAADKIDKGHMISAGTKASDMGMSQVPENALGNRRMGKLNAFSRRVMGELDLPGGGGSGKLASGKTPKSARVKMKLAERDQEGWLKAATDYVANRKVDPETGEVIFTESREFVLTPADKLRIQRKFGTEGTIDKRGIFSIPLSGQEQAAQQIIAEKRIIEAFFEAGLGDRPDEMKALKEILAEISSDEQMFKAQYISEQGQLQRAAEDNPMARLEDLKGKTKETYGVTVQRGKTAEKRAFGLSPKTKTTELPRGNTPEEESIMKYINAKKRELND